MISFLKLPEFPLIHCSKKNDIVERLLEIIHVYEHNTKVYKDENDRLKGIIAELQNAPKKPTIKPSSIEKPTAQNPSRTHEPKKPKADRLIIHEHRTVRPEKIPSNALFKGHQRIPT